MVATFSILHTVGFQCPVCWHTFVLVHGGYMIYIMWRISQGQLEDISRAVGLNKRMCDVEGKSKEYAGSLKWIWTLNETRSSCGS